MAQCDISMLTSAQDNEHENTPLGASAMWQQDLFRFSDDPFLSEFGWAVDQDLLNNMGLSGW